jgi:hypothetical protein
MPERFTAKDVVDQLDNCIMDEPYWFFMDLQNGYFYTANSRLTLYADESRWAIVFEKNGYNNRALRIDLELNFFGNCLQNLDRAGADDRYVCNAKWGHARRWRGLGPDCIRVRAGFAQRNLRKGAREARAAPLDERWIRQMGPGHSR